MVTERRHHWRCLLPYWGRMRPAVRRSLRSPRVRADFLAARHREVMLGTWRPPVSDARSERDGRRGL